MKFNFKNDKNSYLLCNSFKEKKRIKVSMYFVFYYRIDIGR